MSKILRAVLCVLFVVAAPFIAHGTAKTIYLASYHGECGPHAPDIPAHPCSFEQYCDEWGAGFAGLGVLLFDAVGGLFLAVVGCLVLGRLRRGRDVKRPRRRQRADPGSPSSRATR